MDSTHCRLGECLTFQYTPFPVDQTFLIYSWSLKLTDSYYLEVANSFYDLKLANIAGFAESQLTGISSFLPGSAANIFSKVVDLPGLRFHSPDGVFKISDPTEAQVNTMEEAGLRRDPANLNVFRGTPSFSHFGQVMALDPSTYRPGPTEVTPDSIVAYIFLLKGMAIFSSLSGTFVNPKSGVSFPGQAVSGKGSVSVEYGRNDKIKSTFTLDTPGWVIASSTALHSIAVPSDSTKRFTSGYTAMSQFTSTPHHSSGRYFPYFEGMVLPDRSYAYTVFQRVFPQLLHADLTKVPALLQRIKKGAAALADKTAGMAISHAYLGIQLAIQSHAAITFVITRGVYQGFMLSGEFTIVLYKDIIDGIPQADCLADLLLLNTHDKAMLAIKGHFEGKTLIDGTIIYPFDVDQLNTSRRLFDYLTNINPDEYADIPDFWKVVDKLIDQLDFGDEWSVINTQSIESFLDYIQTGDKRLLSEKPAYLRGGYYRSCRNNKIATGLSVFGEKAPSCNFGPKGNHGFTINIPKLGTPDNNLADDGVLKKLPFQSMHPSSATGQWTSLFAEGILRLPKGDQKRKEFCKMSGVAFHLHRGSMPAFVAIYDRIKTYSSSVRSATGSKRKGAVREDRQEVSGPSKKIRGDLDMY